MSKQTDIRSVYGRTGHILAWYQLLCYNKVNINQLREKVNPITSTETNICLDDNAQQISIDFFLLFSDVFFVSGN